jgi:NAD(P)-dependent dehydrogenase (short-subunit alcohol dehydrogenase family)
MPALSFQQLARQLAAAGAEPAVIARMTEELKDHCADAEAAAQAQGASPSEARRLARRSLGSAESIVAAVVAQPQLLDWRHRWPQSARCIDSLIYCLLLPAAPIVYYATHPASLVRWGLSSSLALCVTGTLLFAMQWAMV